LTKTVKNIVEKLFEAKEAYYNTDTPVMSDAEFDKLEDELKKVDPDNGYFKMVGTGGNTKTKVTHQIPMLSAGKAKTTDEVMKWLGKVAHSNQELVVEGKIDGLSATAVYEMGVLTMVATRGDGVVGQDITHIAQYVNIPKTISLNERIEVRGELYIPKDSTVPNPTNKPLRNMAVGFVNRKGGKHTLTDLKYVHFVTYQVHGSKLNKENVKMEWLKENNFETVAYKVITGKAQIEKYHDDYLATIRNDWQYETDGLVLVVNDNKEWDKIDSKYEVSHHHHYNIALKPPSEGKETYLRSIEWNVSRLGRFIPVAIVDPIVLGGATIQRCTLNNYENVTKLKLNADDKVTVERANDVIPFFKQNLTAHKTHGKELIPNVCNSCGTKVKVEGIHLVCDNSDCKEQNVLKIVHWVKNCEMEQFSEASVRALFDAEKIKTIKDLYALEAKDFDGVEGFGKRKTANAIAQIEATKEMTIGEFVDRLGIDLVGVKAIKKLGITTPAGLLAHKDRQYVIGQNLQDFIKANKAYVTELLSCVTIKKPVAVVAPKAGSKNVCFTGKGPKKRDELIADIQAKGDVYIDRVTKDTNILVCEDITGGSGKLNKARKLGVELQDYTQYFGT
jgi:DNA ligase (NAD+)